MGSDRDDGFLPARPEEVRELTEKASGAAETQKLDADVNGYLQSVLAGANDRAPEQTRRYLEELRRVLAGVVDIEQLLLAGSVAKHTYVDEQSDVDALAILDRDDLMGKTPREVLDDFFATLDAKLSRDKVARVEKGKIAVTVTYGDGTEIQLLPALRSSDRVSVPGPAGSWNATKPKVFQDALTAANERLNGRLVPTIKLLKKVVSAFSDRKKDLTGYHCEALALDAVKEYRGSRTCKALLVHALRQAADRVLSPIRDVTGQSRTVDAYLGQTSSAERRIVADALASAARRLNAATTLEQWKRIVEPSE